MRSPEQVARVFELRQDGLNCCEIARRVAIPRRTVQDWVSGRLPQHRAVPEGCPHCGHPAHDFETSPAQYAYLLGMYLGDGCLSLAHRDVYRLRVVLDSRYPAIIAECASAISAVMPRNRVHLLKRRGERCVEVSSWSKAWPCLFPQHGPGKKHMRTIELADWQTCLVTRDPELLLRGLIHSDGCRFQNTGRNWSHPRYAFSNVSADIKRIFCEACELLGLHWTAAGKKTIYVSRVADVARMDEFIGPKR